MKEIILDGTVLADRERAQEYLKETFGFPEYYGKNLDALHDCLTDMQNVIIRITEAEEETEYLKRILRVMKRAETETPIIVKYGQKQGGSYAE